MLQQHTHMDKLDTELLSPSKKGTINFISHRDRSKFWPVMAVLI